MNIAILCRTWWRGRLVGEDTQGNRYYEDKKKMRYGKPRRWVIYKGRAEASKIPADWHGWLHFTASEPPTPRQRYPWEKEHLPNLTGTPYAHQPKGLQGATPDKGYEAWVPED
jgi:NADH:ubiquinone oxidoreductase subunit